jgi:hypothetical protein
MHSADRQLVRTESSQGSCCRTTGAARGMRTKKSHTERTENTEINGRIEPFWCSLTFNFFSAFMRPIFPVFFVFLFVLFVLRPGPFQFLGMTSSAIVQ